MTAVHVPQDFYWAVDRREPTDALQRRALILVGGCGNGSQEGGADRVAFVGDQVVVASTWPHGGIDLDLLVMPLAEFVAWQCDKVATEIGREELADLLALAA